MTVNAYNLVILIGAAHGLTLSALLLRSPRNRRSSNVLLASLLTIYTLPVLKVVLLDLGWLDLAKAWFGPIELLYGLGPALYLYAKTVTDHDYELGRRDAWHFLPVVLEVAYHASPLYDERTIQAFIPVRSAHHLIWMLQQVGAILSVLAYLALTNRLLFSYAHWVRAHHSDERHRALRWLRIPVTVYTVFFGLWFALRLVDVVGFDDRWGVVPYYPLLLFLSLSTYWIGTRGYLETQAPTTGFSRAEPEPGAGSADEPPLQPIFQRLERLMVDDKLYRENDLSLTGLAKRLEINPRLLSRAINTQAGKNFYDYVNGHRVAELEQRLGSGDQGKLLDLALECGFGSKATFNAVFKKVTGRTPSQYREQVHSQAPASRAPTPTSRAGQRRAPGR